MYILTTDVYTDLAIPLLVIYLGEIKTYFTERHVYKQHFTHNKQKLGIT